MGVLKNLTEEYFEKTLREERGKYLDVRGCRVIVPREYNEEMFLDTVQKLLTVVGSYFTTETLFNTFVDKEVYTVAYCKNDYYLMILDDFESFKYYNEDMFVNEELFNSFIEFMRYILKDIEVFPYSYGDENYYAILLASYDEIYDLIDEDDDEQYQFDEYIMPIVDEFFKEFEEKASIIRSEMLYDDLTIAMETENNNKDIQLRTLLFANEMRQWWIDKIKEVADAGGAKEYHDKNSDE